MSRGNDKVSVVEILNTVSRTMVSLVTIKLGLFLVCTILFLQSTESCTTTKES